MRHKNQLIKLADKNNFNFSFCIEICFNSQLNFYIPIYPSFYYFKCNLHLVLKQMLILTIHKFYFGL